MAAVRIGRTRRFVVAMMMMTASAILVEPFSVIDRGVTSADLPFAPPGGILVTLLIEGLLSSMIQAEQRVCIALSPEERTGVGPLQYHGLVGVEQKVLRLRDCGCGGGNARRSFVPASLDGISAVGRRNLLTSSAIVLFVAVIPFDRSSIVATGGGRVIVVPVVGNIGYGDDAAQ